MKLDQTEEPATAVPGGGLPDWLTAGLPKLIEALRYTIKREATYPSHPELYLRLEAIKNAVQLLVDEFPDLQIHALLLDGDQRIENENVMYHGLCDLAARAARVLARNPRTQGRHKLYPEASVGPNALELCALMVGLAYCKGLGTWPGKSNAKAHQACQAIWEAAGGPPRSGWSVAGWRNHLKAARRYRPPHPAGMHIQHILSAEIGIRPTQGQGRRGSLRPSKVTPRAATGQQRAR